MVIKLNMKNNIKTPKTNKSQTLDSFKTIMNPTTGKMVQSGGQLGKKLIKDYKADTIYNPLTKKQVKTGGSVGKKVLSMYRGGAAPVPPAQAPTQINEQTFYEYFKVLYNKSNHPTTRSALAFIWFLQHIKNNHKTLTYGTPDTYFKDTVKLGNNNLSIWMDKHTFGQIYPPTPKNEQTEAYKDITGREIDEYEEEKTIREYNGRIKCKYNHDMNTHIVTIDYTYGFKPGSTWESQQIISATFEYKNGELILKDSNDSQMFFLKIKYYYDKIKKHNGIISEHNCWTGPGGIATIYSKGCNNVIINSTYEKINNPDTLKVFITNYQIITMLIYNIIAYMNITFSYKQLEAISKKLKKLSSNEWIPSEFKTYIVNKT